MARFRRVPFGDGELVFALDVDPWEVAHQPGDGSVASAGHRAAKIAARRANGNAVHPPQLRLNRDGALEVWDGNARLHHYRSRNERFDAIVVDPQGCILREVNPSVPTDPDLYDELVAEVRGLVDRQQVPFGWPSEQATAWLTREYELQGGRWQKRRVPRRRPAQERRESRRYQELYAVAGNARDVWEIASAITAARAELKTPLLVGVVETHGVKRAKALGFQCPFRRDCADALVELLANRQGALFNPSPEIPVRGDREAKKFAQWGLKARRNAPKSLQGGLDTRQAGEQGVGSGVARARDIAAGKNVDAKQVKAYFARHERHYKAAMRRAKQRIRREGITLRKAAEREPAIQGWWLWGGDPMRELAEAAVTRAASVG